MKENNEVELSIKVKNDEDVEIKTYGTRVELLAGLALIINALTEDCCISKSTIKEVVEMELSGEFENAENKDKEETDNKNKSSEEDSLVDILIEIFKRDLGL